MGGKASGQARVKRKSFRNAVVQMLQCQVPKKSKYYHAALEAFKALGIDDEPTVLDLVNLGILKRASEGDVQAAVFLRDTSGEKPTDVVEQIDKTPPVMLGVIPIEQK